MVSGAKFQKGRRLYIIKKTGALVGMVSFNVVAHVTQRPRPNNSKTRYRIWLALGPFSPILEKARPLSRKTPGDSILSISPCNTRNAQIFSITNFISMYNVVANPRG